MVLCTQVNKMYVIATLSVYPHRASLKNMPGHGGIPPWPGIFFKLAQCGYTLRVAITYIVLYSFIGNSYDNKTNTVVYFHLYFIIHVL